MLRFTNGLYCHIFRLEIALVLHHASVWGELTGIVVDVNSLADKQHGPATLHTFDLGVDLDTQGDRRDQLAQLHGYLSRVLPPEYDVVLEADHVHVEWDARRKPAPVAMAFQNPAPAAG